MQHGGHHLEPQGRTEMKNCKKRRREKRGGGGGGGEDDNGRQAQGGSHHRHGAAGAAAAHTTAGQGWRKQGGTLCSCAFVGFVAFSISRFTIAISDQTALFLILAWRCLEPADF